MSVIQISSNVKHLIRESQGERAIENNYSVHLNNTLRITLGQFFMMIGFHSKSISMCQKSEI